MRKSHEDKVDGRFLRELLRSEGYQVSEVDAQRIITVARRAHKRAEDECNGLENTLAIRHEEEDKEYIRGLVKNGTIPPVKFTGDPRGFCFKFLFPSGRYNTWGGKEEGYGI